MMTANRPKSVDGAPGSLPLRWIPSWLMNVWIASVVIAFLIVRGLGSGTGQRVLHLMCLR